MNHDSIFHNSIHSFLDKDSPVLWRLTNWNVRFTLYSSYICAPRASGKLVDIKHPLRRLDFICIGPAEKPILQYHKFVLTDMVYSIYTGHLKRALKEEGVLQRGEGFIAGHVFPLSVATKERGKYCHILQDGPWYFVLNWHHTISNCFCLCVLWFESVPNCLKQMTSTEVWLQPT